MKDINKYTLITGASSGFGFEFAKIFAKGNHNLILIARNIQKLKSAKEDIKSLYNVNVEILSVDLSVDKAWEKIACFVDKKNIVVDYLINNAGIGSFGYFKDEKEGFEEEIININITSLTKLTKYFFKKMALRGEGNILNVSSTAAFVGGPKMALYYASKAYVLSLTEALHEEGKEFNVNVCCLCPGAADTNFQKNAGIKKSDLVKNYLMSAEFVAKIGAKGLIKKKAIIIPGYKNKLLIFVNRLISRSFSRKIIFKCNKN